MRVGLRFLMAKMKNRYSFIERFFYKLFLTYPRLGYAARDTMKRISDEEQVYRNNIREKLKKEYFDRMIHSESERLLRSSRER